MSPTQHIQTNDRKGEFLALTFIGSFVAEGDHGIDLHGAASGKESG